MYSILAVSEALGSSNQSQVLDLGMNNQNAYTPGYAIYEKGTLARVALFNYMTDPTGANAYTATIQVGGQTPAQVKVKYVVFAVVLSMSNAEIISSGRYLLASSVSDHFNITWAGQVRQTIPVILMMRILNADAVVTDLRWPVRVRWPFDG